MHSNTTIPLITISFLPFFSIPFVLLAPSLLHFFFLLYSSRLCDLVRGSAMSGEDGYGGRDEAVREMEGGKMGDFGGRNIVRHFSSF